MRYKRLSHKFKRNKTKKHISTNNNLKYKYSKKKSHKHKSSKYLNKYKKYKSISIVNQHGNGGLYFSKASLFKNKVAKAINKNWSYFTSETIKNMINSNNKENDAQFINIKMIIYNEVNNTYFRKHFKTLLNNPYFTQFIIDLLTEINKQKTYDKKLIKVIITNLMNKYLKNETKGSTFFAQELALTSISAAGAKALGAKGPLIF